MESFILFFEKCRLCLNQSGVYNMFENKSFPEDIYLCTGIKVHSSDNLPKNLCKRCFKVIQSAATLRILASRNNTHLKALLDSGSVLTGNKNPENDMHITNSNNAETQEIMKRNNENQTVSTSSKTISVRKDLFESSSTVSSTEKETTPSETTDPCREQRVAEKRQSTAREEQVNNCSCKRKKAVNSATIFKCSVCFKKFYTWKKLYLHKRLHNKTIVCPLDTCGKKFATNADLEKHYRTHTGERPFECDLCDRSFSQKVTLKVHKEKLHDVHSGSDTPEHSIDSVPVPLENTTGAISNNPFPTFQDTRNDMEQEPSDMKAGPRRIRSGSAFL